MTTEAIKENINPSGNSTSLCAFSPTEVIQKIAEYSAQVGFSAGVASMEGAGQIVSILAANPELIDGFLADPHEFVLQNEIMWRAQNGCLSWYARGTGPEPKIVSPAERRAVDGAASH